MSIVWIIMKYFFLCLLSIVIVSCTSQPIDDATRRSRIVDIVSPYSESRWVILETGKVLTVRHGIDDCLRYPIRSDTYHSEWCSLRIDGVRYPISTITLPDQTRDIALIRYAGWQEYTPVRLTTDDEMHLWQSVYLFTSTGKITGQILSLAPSYIAYDSHLSWSLLSGSLMMDIIVERGESGTPIWTLSGELLWVMSAVDIAGKRSYGVR